MGPIDPNLDLTKLTPFAKGGIVNAPTAFPMSGGMGLMGESGPKVIAPLQRNGSGQMTYLFSCEAGAISDALLD